jgi:hypothetical protein
MPVIFRFALLSTLALLAGCSSSGPGVLGGLFQGSGPAVSEGECGQRPGSCIYKGQYEPGEGVYAEQEAARLNRASLERLKRASVR